jgi:PIN domain nuclease of toxin-antitoxin system
VSVAHAAGAEQLPPHHRDPFDRMLGSQARAEGAALVSGDDALRPYGVTLVW